MKWLFLIFKLRELKRLHKYNEKMYWRWVETWHDNEKDEDYDYEEEEENHIDIKIKYYENQIQRIESQIKLLT